MRRLAAAASALAMGIAQPAAVAQVGMASPMLPITLKARDGVTVFGTLYRNPNPRAVPKATILLFHQAHSSRGEYKDIAPRLMSAGYQVLAIDQRSGGGMFGGNVTAQRLGPEKAAALAGDAGYIQALPDMQAALDWASARRLPVILWGSSYSSSLVFRLAADNPGKAKALLAFSPGEYFADSRLVRTAAAKVTTPVFVTTDGSAREIAAAKPIVEAIRAPRTVYAPKDGVHGSSLLNPQRNPAGSEAAWREVLAFLKTVSP